MNQRLCHRFVAWLAVVGLGLVVFGLTPGRAQMSMPMPGLPTSHGAGEGSCQDPVLACASTVTPTFGSDGSLWLAFDVHNRVFVTHSLDLGKTFAPPLAITPGAVNLDNGPDARAAIAVDREGRVFVSYAIFRDNKFNGELFFSRSLDHGKTFSTPRPLVDNTASQRFPTLTLDPQGKIFAAWLDKRGVVAAAKLGKDYPGAALAYSWSSDNGATFTPSQVAHDNTCECCRLGVAFTGAGEPAVMFRNVFGGTIRDHAVITFANDKPGPLERVSVDNWRLDGCPHHGPSLAISQASIYHAAWFTQGDARKGLFYARSGDGGKTFSTPMALGNEDHDLSRPYVVALPGAVWLAWKEFDGEIAAINVKVSHDDGVTWSPTREAARTADASDHPMLVSNGHAAYLSWMTKNEGYRFLPLKDVP